MNDIINNLIQEATAAGYSVGVGTQEVHIRGKGRAIIVWRDLVALPLGAGSLNQVLEGEEAVREFLELPRRQYENSSSDCPDPRIE